MYDIVIDINSYSEFIPGCVVSKIISEENHSAIATLGIKYSVMSGEFTSQVNFNPENLTIFSEGIKGPFRQAAFLCGVTKGAFFPFWVPRKSGQVWV